MFSMNVNVMIKTTAVVFANKLQSRHQTRVVEYFPETFLVTNCFPYVLETSLSPKSLPSLTRFIALKKIEILAFYTLCGYFFNVFQFCVGRAYSLRLRFKSSTQN